jgi:hypothetical protein
MKKDPRPRMRLVPAPAGETEDAGVRWSRVTGARSRIAAGYYDRVEVRERLLDVLLEELER